VRHINTIKRSTFVRRMAHVAMSLALCGLSAAHAQLVIVQPGADARVVSSETAAPELAELRQALAKFPFEMPADSARKIATGDTTPLLLVGLEAIRGTHVPRNFGLAIKHLEFAAARSDARAMAALAMAHANGWGVPRDISRARDMLQALQRIQFSRASCMLAEVDSRMPGGAMQQRTRALLQEGAAQNDSFCLNLLGIAYELDGAVSQAHDAYKAAAAAGSAAGNRNLQRMQTRLVSAQNSMVELLMQAEAGNPQAQFDLARRLHRGVGMPRDFAGALRWYREAAFTHPQAREILSLILQENQGAETGDLDAETMQKLSMLPAIASVAQPASRQPPVREADVLIGLESLPFELYAEKLRDASGDKYSVIAKPGAVPATAAPASSVDTKVVLAVSAGGTPTALPVIASNVKPGSGASAPPATKAKDQIGKSVATVSKTEAHR
jgi:uncharacterized protein